MSTPEQPPGEVPAYGTPPVPAPVPAQRTVSGRSLRTGAGAAAVGLSWAAKAGLFAKVLLSVAKLKFAVSILLSIVVYTMFWGWPFAVGFVLLMLLHELGHVAELRRQGIATSAVMFVPLLGAYTKAHEATKSARDGATVAFAGPLVGTVAATACYYLGQVSGSLLLVALAHTGFLLNLVNLLPVPPLDGGRVAGALHPALWFAGLAVGGWYFLTQHANPILLLVLVLGVWQVVRWWRGRAERSEYLTVPPRERAAIAGAYAALVLWCLWGMHVAFVVVPQ